MLRWPQSEAKSRDMGHWAGFTSQPKALPLAGCWFLLQGRLSFHLHINSPIIRRQESPCGEPGCANSDLTLSCPFLCPVHLAPAVSWGLNSCCSLQVGELIACFSALFVQWPGQGKDKVWPSSHPYRCEQFTMSWEKADGAPTATCATQPAPRMPLRGPLMVGCLPGLLALAS